MDLAEVRAELEDELTWRLSEMRFFSNQLSDLNKEVEQDRFRRALVVMLYSHFEGFWKSAFEIYVNAINRCDIRCVHAVEAVGASAFSDIFDAMTDGNRKCDFFRSQAPDDTKLHRLHRHQEFLVNVTEYLNAKVRLVPEKIVNTESNLKPVVMRKNLFRLGFNPSAFKHLEGTVDRLLQLRNQIAHGATRDGVPKIQYEALEHAVNDVMQQTLMFIYEALRDKKYLRDASADFAI